jgi:phage terminase small subunit
VIVTPKQEAFVREYLTDLNATQAAIRAGYSDRTAEQAGFRLLRNVQVARAISAAQQKRAARLEITADRVLQELARIAFFDPRKVLKADGTAKPLQDLDDDTAAAIAGLEVQEITVGENVVGTVKKYRITDKNAALSNAMRHLGMLREKLEVSGSIDVGTLLREARERMNRG